MQISKRNVKRERTKEDTKRRVPQKHILRGSGCGSVGRAVAFKSRGPRFDSSHSQNFIENLFVNLFIISCIEKMKIIKRGREWPTFKKEIYIERQKEWR